MMLMKFVPRGNIYILAKFGDCSFKNVAARGLEMKGTKSQEKKCKKMAVTLDLFSLPIQILCFFVA